MFTNISDDLKKIVLAGIGAVATTAEKSKQVLDELVKKGEMTVEQGKVLNEELKRNVETKVKNESTTTASNTNKPTMSASSIANQLDKMSKEDIAAIKAKLAELERKADDGETGE